MASYENRARQAGRFLDSSLQT